MYAARNAGVVWTRPVAGNHRHYSTNASSGLVSCPSKYIVGSQMPFRRPPSVSQKKLYCPPTDQPSFSSFNQGNLINGS
jgi:hypothetical protein